MSIIKPIDRTELLLKNTDIVYNNQNLTYKSINSFYKIPKKSKNDTHNKIRESIIGAIINKKIPHEYFRLGSRWLKLKHAINVYCKKLLCKDEWNTITKKEVVHMGGRGNNYDMVLIFYKENEVYNQFNIEFKFNCKTVRDNPQFVSPMKPSKYMSSSYEEYYYNKYLPQICEIAELPIPDKDVYFKQLHSNKPKCMLEFKVKYDSDNVFNMKCKEISRKSIFEFIEKNDLNIEKIKEYLLETQKNKKYMLYCDGSFVLEEPIMDSYKIKSFTKNPKLSRYDCIAEDGTKIQVLLRWKNGNGIAFPAFQIK
jgi:hypothetical protein